MKLDTLKPDKGGMKTKKRIGRGPGSGFGKTSGRGHKGAGQRSGNKKRPWFEGGQMPLSRRLPRRGFTNIFKEKYQIVNLSDIDKIDSTIEINSSILYKLGFIRSAFKAVKVLGSGNLSNKFTITVSAFSEAAKIKIEKAGGKAIVQ